jgi:hypothetical protein
MRKAPGRDTLIRQHMSRYIYKPRVIGPTDYRYEFVSKLKSWLGQGNTLNELRGFPFRKKRIGFNLIPAVYFSQ